MVPSNPSLSVIGSLSDCKLTFKIVILGVFILLVDEFIVGITKPFVKLVLSQKTAKPFFSPPC